MKALKEHGKWALYAFLAYQVVGLVILVLNFDTIWADSQQMGNDIAVQLIGVKQ